MVRRYRNRTAIHKAEKHMDRGENFKLWVKGNEINNAEVWKLEDGLYEVKRKNQYTDGYLSPVFFVWDIRHDKQLLSTLSYTDAFEKWKNSVCDSVFYA